MRLVGEPRVHEDGMVTQWFEPDAGGPPYGQLILRMPRATPEQLEAMRSPAANLRAAMRYMQARYGRHEPWAAYVKQQEER
jgi:hypothetical protein